MEGSLSCVASRVVDIGAALEQELTELPVPVKRRGAEADVLAERCEQMPLRDEKPDGADVTVVGTPSDQRHSAGILRAGSSSLRKVIEHQVRAPVDNPLQHGDSSFRWPRERF